MNNKRKHLEISGHSWRKHRKRNIELSLMIIPGLTYLLINNYLPMAGIIIAFKKYNYSMGLFKSPWAGLSNFTYLFKSSDALNIIRNTIGYNMVFILLGQTFGIIVAIMLNFLKGTMNKKIFQTLILIPYLISIVVISYIVFGFLSVENGFLNKVITAFGGQAISWYTEEKYWPFILTTVNLWKGFGYSSILYYASVIGIDSSLYDAASIDGCNTAQKIKYVTLTGLRPTIITLVLMSLGGIMYSDFGLFYQVPMHSGQIAGITDTIDVYVYKALIQLNDIGRSSASGFLQSVVGFTLVITVNAIVRKIDKDSALF